MKISDGEKLILLMLTEIYDHLSINNGIESEFVKKIVHGGHHWALKRRYPGIFHDYEDDDAAVSEVGDILDMWSTIIFSYENLTYQEERQHQEASKIP